MNDDDANEDDSLYLYSSLQFMWVIPELRVETLLLRIK